MRLRYLITIFYPSLLAMLLLILTFLTLQPAQAAPSSQPNQVDILVTTTIQAAIDAAIPGDTVIVPAGLYTESLTLSKVVSITGVSSGTTIIYALPNQRVLTITGAAIDNSVVISGLTLRGGSVTGGTSVPSCPTLCGGGILITDTAQPLLQNLIFSNNQANLGGGVYAHRNSPLTLLDVIFDNNTAGVGGGLYAGDQLIVTSTYFISNTAGGGGGVHAHRTARLTDSYFEGNSSTGTGGGLFAVEELILINTSFFSNTAADWAGGVLGLGPTKIIGGRFQQNIADYGAGLTLDNVYALTGTQFFRNVAAKGGGIYLTDQDPSFSIPPNGYLVNALFAGNTATNTGAALYVDAPGRVEIFHTTIATPGSNPGTAVAVVSGTVSITNTIIASHTIGISQTAGIVSEDYNLFFSVPITNTGVVVHGGHSLTGNPRFVAPASDDYHLDGNSAALNVAFPGLVNNDFEGDLRPLGDGPDIGFDESPFSPILAISKTVNPVGLLTPGQTFTYTIVISNSGEATANNVLITDTFPTSVTGTNLFTIATIPADQSLTFTLTGTVATDIPSNIVITNTASYSHTSSNGQASAVSTVQSNSPNFWTYLPFILKN